MRRPVRMLQVPALLLALAAAGAAGPADEEGPCVDFDLAPGAAEAYLADAVRVLRASGHDPGHYEASFRLDDPLLGFVALGRGPRPGVVFTPRRPGPGEYPLRVSSAHPCVTAWAADRAGLTEGQRQVLDRALERLDNPPMEGETLQILESEGYYQVEVWEVSAGGGAPRFTGRAVRLHKSDLSPAYNDR